jgi:iron complex transport system permease protein
VCYVSPPTAVAESTPLGDQPDHAHERAQSTVAAGQTPLGDRLRSELSSKRRWRWIGLLLALVLLVVLSLASLALGAKALPLAEVYAALTGGPASPEAESLVIGLRLPRTVAGIITGAALALAGALIQALTRNPLADPGILGVNAGAAAAVALAVGLLGISQPGYYVLFGLVGALVASLAVSVLGLGDPLRLVLVGMALGAVLAGLTGAIRLTDREAFNAMVTWEIGSLTDKTWNVIVPLLPFALLGVVIALAVGPALDALVLGKDTAASLGVNILLTRVLALAAISLLAGSATALAGPISFIGLMVPHLARRLTGPSQPWILALSAILGPSLLLAADIIGRLVVSPAEIRTAIVAAFIGAPILIQLALRRKLVML